MTLTEHSIKAKGRLVREPGNPRRQHGVVTHYDPGYDVVWVYWRPRRSVSKGACGYTPYPGTLGLDKLEQRARGEKGPLPSLAFVRILE